MKKKNLCHWRCENLQCQVVYGMYPIGKASSTTSFSSDDAFPNISLSAKKLELFINKTFC